MRLLTREALLSFSRAPLLSALSITTIGFSLFTVGLFGLVAINLRQALRGIEERVEIVAFVLRGTPAEQVQDLTRAGQTERTRMRGCHAPIIRSAEVGLVDEYGRKSYVARRRN